VICVGNYHVGGAGKTPFVMVLVELLKELGENPFVLSRGYGGKLRGPVLVKAPHDASDVGDEPLLLSRAAPVVVARDRLAGALRARELGASVIVMDDGFQSPALRKDMSIVVIDSGRGIGNGGVFPAGPLRAPLDVQIARTDALVVVGQGRGAGGVAGKVAARGAPVWHARFRPDEGSLGALRGQRVLAFAGIGDPERFFRTLRNNGIDVARTRVFDDHHLYSIEEIEQLTAEAAAEQLVLVSTEKDMVRLGGEGGVLASLRRNIQAFAVTLDLAERDALRALVVKTLTSTSPRAGGS
jgi:tetraacyldisaccharide 4'-kinase